MEIIFFIIAIIGVSALLTFLVSKLILKVETSRFSFPKFSKINFPKIKFPSFRKKRQGQIMTITCTTPSENIFQEDLEIEYENGEYKRTIKKNKKNNSSFPILKKDVWVMMVGVVVIGLVAMYFMKRWRR